MWEKKKWTYCSETTETKNYIEKEKKNPNLSEAL